MIDEPIVDACSTEGEGIVKGKRQKKEKESLTSEDVKNIVADTIKGSLTEIMTAVFSAQEAVKTQNIENGMSNRMRGKPAKILHPDNPERQEINRIFKEGKHQQRIKSLDLMNKMRNGLGYHEALRDTNKGKIV